MKGATRNILTRTLSILLLAGVAVSQQNNSPEAMLRAAMDKQLINGDLKGAIELYKKVADGKDHALAAQALARIAKAYEALGASAEAQKIYEHIVREYADQKEIAAQAQAQLGHHPPSLSPTDDDSSARKDSLTSILQGPSSRTPGDLPAGVFVADIAPDGHAHGPVITLMQEPGISYWAPAWSPNGEVIQAKRKSPPERRESFVLYSMTKKEARIVGGGPQQPNPWFHDSLHLLGYDEIRPIVVMRNLSQAFGEPLLTMDFPVAPNLMALSPDDKTLYLVPRPILSGREGMAAGLLGIPPGQPENNKLITVDMSTRKEKQRLTLPVAESVRELALSPDGRTLAMWTVADTRTGESRLFRVGTDGSGYRELYRGHGATVAWASDGRSIFFGQSDTGYAYCLGCGHDWQVMRIPADGGKEQFTGLRVKGLQYISLSPEGKRLVFDGSAPNISATNAR